MIGQSQIPVNHDGRCSFHVSLRRLRFVRRCAGVEDWPNCCSAGLDLKVGAGPLSLLLASGTFGQRLQFFGSVACRK